MDREKERLLYHWEKTEEPLVMQVTEKETYTVFTVLECPDSFDFLEIGPIVTSLNEVVGDVIGVVQGGMAAIGIQALNVKTLAGFPYELKDQVIYRKETPTSELTVSVTWIFPWQQLTICLLEAFCSYIVRTDAGTE